MDYILSALCQSSCSSEINIPLYEVLPESDKRNIDTFIDESVILSERGWYSDWKITCGEASYDIEDLYVNDESIKGRDQPFVLEYGFVQFRAVIRREGEKLSLVSKACPVDNRTDTDNISDMISRILNVDAKSDIFKMLRWTKTDPESTYESRRKDEDTKYSMFSGDTFSHRGSPDWVMAENILAVYKKHGSYFLTKPEFTVVKEHVPALLHQVKQLSQSSVLWSVKHGEVRPVSGSKGVTVNGQNYAPTRTLTAAASKNCRIYENMTVVSFLDTVINWFKSRKSIQENQSVFSLLNIILASGSIGTHEDAEALDRLISDLIFERNLYIRYLNLKNEKLPPVINLPRHTKRFQEIQPYREIYSVIYKWFNRENLMDIDGGAIFRGRLADTIYEYFCWLQILTMFSEHGWKISDTRPPRRVSYGRSNYSMPAFANIVPLVKGNTTVTLYFNPWIPSWKSPMKETLFEKYGIDLMRVSVNNTETEGYSPDFLIKVEKTHVVYRSDSQSSRKNPPRSETRTTVEYGILDAKFRPLYRLFNDRKPQDADMCTMEEAIYKYYLDISAMHSPYRPVKMVWLLQGRYENRGDDCTVMSKYHPDATLGFMDKSYLKYLSWGAISLNSKNSDAWRRRFWNKLTESFVLD